MSIEAKSNKLASIEAQEFTPLYDVLEIVGEAGTGTSSTGIALAKSHGAKFISIGDIVGRINEKISGGSLIGGREIEGNIDNKMNRVGQLILENTHREVHGKVYERRPIIVDSRLGAMLAIIGKQKAEKEGREYPKVVNIRLTANEREAARRISMRKRIDFNEAYEETTIRNKKDKEAFQNMLPEEFKGKDIYGDEFFDLTINTDNLSVDGNVVAINTWLRENGYLA